MSERCLVCGKETDNLTEHHPRCSRNFFGVFPPPVLEIALEDLQEFAAKSVLARVTVTGVQKKLSVGIEEKGKDSRFTIVGIWGTFILKPPVKEYRNLPENEDLIMRLAEIAGIRVVPHALIRLGSGELAYITRRIDRIDIKAKVAMEDFCQIFGRLTEDKYKGSVERIGKLLRQYSIFPGLDVIDLFERVIFNYVCGNSDMHLKNYSLIETEQGMRLSPAYDLLSTCLVIPEDSEESALTINGKKSRLEKRDFDALGKNIGIPDQAISKMYLKVKSKRNDQLKLIKSSLLPADMRDALCQLIAERVEMF